MLKKILGMACLSLSLWAGEVQITAAADLVYAFKEMQVEFEKAYPGEKAHIAFGSTGKAYTQIVNGAPYDMYFAADMGYVQKLKDAGLISHEPKPYAYGRIGLWAPKTNNMDVKRGLELLLDPKVKKIAIADPSHAPYGVAAVNALKSQNYYDKIQDRLVLGENVSQAAQFIQTGAAEVGIIPLSLGISDTLKAQGDFFLLPSEWHNEIIQGYALLKNGENNPTAQKFEAFVGTPQARAIFKRYGFVLPGEL
ncbi:molybdate ABC transporter substrate-binding protein [Sulfurospirillum diekertiae]|uniref:Molybdate-binding periplasmic protein n=1 Tax=Sulfurospirillum diekertiae TaxID=1854492 RepID=A0A1Y0HLS2_9BACT|nr:molybdate ABC transporter substrate-binding protein [Sulfurospirillum diekertiae]ARU48183.1 Molybdate-binding periplasmic protein [Sulfurospirillum diekertiae]ASC93026.1 Molybdate-binding periplasmic protein [Sulfurospirillum diekertiae]